MVEKFQVRNYDKTYQDELRYNWEVRNVFYIKLKENYIDREKKVEAIYVTFTSFHNWSPFVVLFTY